MNLSLSFALQRAGFDLAMELEVPARTTVALVGPNGAGKSTCVHAIAGLLRIATGSIRLGEDCFDDGTRDRFVPPEARGIGLLAQNALLFPHLSVRDNVAFGVRMRGQRKVQARAAAEEALDLVGLRALADRAPRELSGGEAQRVALARALASRPRILLLDEPLSAVDASARLSLRQELLAHLAHFDGPRLVVTHDALDAFVLADRIAVIEGGGIVQIGTAAEIGAAPASRYVADLIGLNFYSGVVTDRVLKLDNGEQLFVASATDGAFIATIHPRAIALYTSKPTGSPRNIWSAPIDAIEVAPSGMRVRLGGPIPLVAEITPHAVAELQLKRGASVWVALKATEIQLAPHH